MALANFLSGVSILLLLLLAVASAGDYGYGPKPNPIKSDYKPRPESSDSGRPNNGNVPQPDYVTQKHSPNPKVSTVESDNRPIPKPDAVKSYYYPRPTPDSIKSYSPTPKPDSFNLDYSHNSKPEPVKPYYYSPSPTQTDVEPGNGKLDYGLIPANPLNIAIEGLVLCKSGSNYVPINGAVARIACSAEDQNGYETTAFSCFTGATDAKGYFFQTLPLSDLDEQLKLKSCNAYLESSPLENCKVPTDVNKGITGAFLSSYRILNDKKVKLYSVGPFFYASEPTSIPAPAGY